MGSSLRWNISLQHHYFATAIGVGVGVAGLIFITRVRKLVPWLSTEEDVPELQIYVGGLHNLGNNCFLNVVLQALSSCTYFLSYLQDVLGSDPTLSGEMDETRPLLHTVTSLLEELHIVRDKVIVLDPRKVMHALSSYANNFSMTSQQDAAEAFVHLISSLRKEVLLYHVPLKNALLSSISSSRIHEPKMEELPVCERWKQKLFGPLDGTTCSILTCRSCSSSLSMDFQPFDCLPLTPVMSTDKQIVECSLTDCLRNFTSMEKLENYRCMRCWHEVAMRQSSLRPEIDEELIQKLRSCVDYDTCTCRNFFEPESITWSESCAFKQLVVAYCPKILCIHLQRGLMNNGGEFYKLQGHISFPLFLNLSPFMEATTSPSQRSLNSSAQQRWNWQHDLTSVQMFPGMLLSSEGSNPLKELPQKHSECSSGISLSFGSKNSIYTLCAVVEHYGRYGGGHYASYRKVTSDFSAPNSGACNSKWFYISDRHVSQVSEETVLSAEASLLFYQLI